MPLPAHLVTLAVDVVVVTLTDSDDGRVPLVLTVRRTREPYAGSWALPGSIVRRDEDLEAAIRRVLVKVADVRSPRHLEQLATFGDPGRDPRGRVVTVSYLALLPRPARVHAAAGWWPALDPPPLAFDHAAILAAAVERLRGKLSYSNVAYGLLPDEFTLSDLQTVYEAVLDRPFDKRNFRKKVHALGMVTEAEGQRRGSHRPAQLYRFARSGLVLLDDILTA